jgi:hypothetical protein
VTRPTAPPSGVAPPRAVRLADGSVLDLEDLARAVCERYRTEFPDERERYGEAGTEWCRHDNQYLLQWAVWHPQGIVDLDEKVAWLAKVLEARGFPLARLARDLELCADALAAHAGAAAALRAAAATVRERGTFL